MPKRNIKFLDKELDLPFICISRLNFTEEDLKRMPWLEQDIRYYNIEEADEIGKGGRAKAYKGFVSDSKGDPIEPKVTVIIKIPNINLENFTGEEIKEYLNNIKDECGREWQLTRARLHNCKYANPIFDFFIYPIDYMDLVVDLPITVQLFLDGPATLNGYLQNIGQKLTPYVSEKGTSADNWRGMNNPAKWIEIAKALATGLSDIHQRRVVHGDIWPPNIFMAHDENNSIYPIFIDFGEAFPIEPKGNPHPMGDNAYRAPERKDGLNIITKAADVYSYGKLLLSLAIGEEPIIPSELKGYERRNFIKKKFAERNAAIMHHNPFIVDLICNCVAFDSVDRPSMDEVLRALTTYVNFNEYSDRVPEVFTRLSSLKDTWSDITTELSDRKTSVGPFLQELIDQRLSDIEDMIKGLLNDVIILNDTREKLIVAMVGLFLRMKKGDRFISMTSIAMWQGGALGLDGRYFTATKIATKKEASIQRSFIFSIQEIGVDHAVALANKLEEASLTLNNSNIKDLIRSIRTEIKRYNGLKELEEVNDVDPTVQKQTLKQLKLIVKCHLDAGKEIDKNLIDTSNKYESFEKCKGLYFGLIPVSTNAEMSQLKAAHPVSVFFYNDAPVNDQYLLMMTECHARNSAGDHRYQMNKPELRGLMVFKSVLGVPGDRIKKIQQIFRQQSVNIGGWVEEFYKALDSL